jgi:REP element-mobilizing transposase RayT
MGARGSCPLCPLDKRGPRKNRCKNLKSYTDKLSQHVGFKVLTAVVMKNSVFWFIMPYSPLEVDRHFGVSSRHHRQGRRMLAICLTLVSCMDYSSTLKMEATCSSASSVDFQQTKWRYISKCRTPQLCQNFVTRITRHFQTLWQKPAHRLYWLRFLVVFPGPSSQILG